MRGGGRRGRGGRGRGGRRRIEGGGGLTDHGGKEMNGVESMYDFFFRKNGGKSECGFYESVSGMGDIIDRTWGFECAVEKIEE